MKIKFNPTIELKALDKIMLRRMHEMCEQLVYIMSQHTITEEASMILADTGEILITEKELYTAMYTIENFRELFEDTDEIKVDFIG